MNETFHRLGTDNLSNNNFHRLLYDDNEDFDIYKEIDLDSSYYSPDQFCEKFNNSKNISILSINLQSINAKFSSLSYLIYFWKEKGVIFDIICIQECYSIVIPSIFEISLYHPIVFKTRSTFVGGGVAYYINKSLNFSVLNEYSIFHEKIIESLFIELEFNNKKKLVIGNFLQIS